jgi:indole-3-glycerol phosphate synthase
VEAKAIGADAILLIAEILTRDEIISFTRLAQNLGLSVLLELHQEEELDKVILDVDVIGVNNRDLRNFTVDFNHSKVMYPMLPTEITKISESGISDPSIVRDLLEVGYKGFLIGEYFMSQANPGKACVDFIGQIKSDR